VTSVASVQSISRAVIAALLGFGLVLGADARADVLEKQPLTFIASSGKHRITVEVADTDSERSMGLMFRRSIGDDEGMIFIYPRDEPISMWMKNTYISLDMIFVRSDGTIHRIASDTEPFSEQTISSGENVRAVIEMKAGSAKRLGIKSGDKVEHPAFR
jgi:uncharacterized membrane protein (UPF0127 family)